MIFPLSAQAMTPFMITEWSVEVPSYPMPFMSRVIQVLMETSSMCDGENCIPLQTPNNGMSISNASEISAISVSSCLGKIPLSLDQPPIVKSWRYVGTAGNNRQSYPIAS